ncbi:MAG: GNAT family protein [Candidatus Cloacimonetes bacterium]|nr:GNAT family protein [Candidatus Cloacimonadota bacterium]
MNHNIDKIFAEKPKFETERLLLVPSAEDNFDDYKKMFTNEQINKFLRLSQKMSEEELFENFKRVMQCVEQKHVFVWRITLKTDNSDIGRINIASIARYSSRVDIGYVLLPEYWGQGIMMEAAQRIIDYLFKTINIHKICATTNNENTRSKKLLEKLNFQLEGVLRQHTFYPDKELYADEALYGLINHEETN